MQYLLDTNICVYFLRGKFDLDKILKNKGLDNCCISEVTENVNDFKRLNGIQMENWVVK